MYDQEVVIEMNHSHRTLLKSYDEWLELLNLYLTEQAFPQNLLEHVALYLVTRFHKSALALRLLLISGYCEESCGVLQLMGEYTIILKGILDQPEARVLRWIEDGGHSPDWTLKTIAEEMHLQEGFNSGCNPSSGSNSPQLGIDWEELILPVGPAPFNAEGMLEQACCLAATILDYVVDTEARHA